MTAVVIRGDARRLPLADASVDLIVTSPPYYALRSYTDTPQLCDRCRQLTGQGWQYPRPSDATRDLRQAWPDWDAHVAAEHKATHYDGQIGSEPTPHEYIDNLIACTREWMRVLKPTGSIFVNLGDSYSGKPSSDGTARRDKAGQRGERQHRRPASRQFTREDAAWLAGVIDSDGSVSIRINKQPEGRAPSFVAWIRIGQTRPEIVHRAAELTGVGRIMEDGRGVWNWCASSQQARWVLERIHPWLLIKRRQAWAAIELARHVEDRNGRGEYRPLTADDIAYRHRLRDAAMAWNAGTAFDLDVPEAAAIPLPIYPTPHPEKSLRDLPHWYVQECIGRLGLIKRAEICWSKVNGLPESVTDRVRRSHEFWFHLVKQPRYYSAIDHIRQPHSAGTHPGRKRSVGSESGNGVKHRTFAGNTDLFNPLGALPGSVWEIPTEPLQVPAHLGVDHFAAYPMEWPRRIIQGWSPAGICTTCSEGRRPVVNKGTNSDAWADLPLKPGDVGRRAAHGADSDPHERALRSGLSRPGWRRSLPEPPTLTGEACGCPDTTAPTRPAVVLDPFGGTGTTALVAHALGRLGISSDMSADYCRLATWRTTDPGQLAKAMRVAKPPKQVEDQITLDLFGGDAA